MGDIALFVLGLIVVFIVVALLQRRADREEKAQAELALHDARQTGSDRPIAQHPQIDKFACIGCAACVRACPEEQVLGIVNGVAHIIHGSRCVGHARCEPACPVGALKVGLGDTSARDDLPILSDDFESSIPGVFLAGEITGFALISQAVRMGVRTVDTLRERLATLPKSKDTTERLDVVIVGAGPAGMAAGLRCVEYGLSHLILEQEEIGGTLMQYPRQKLVMTHPVDLPLHGPFRHAEVQKEALLDLWHGLLRDHKVATKARTRFTGLAGEFGDFTVQTSAGTVRARAVILAVGRRGTPRKLGVPGEGLPKVAYRLIDTASYTHRRVLVVGGGDSAVEAAVGLSLQPGNMVHLSYRGAHFNRVKRRNLERMDEARRNGRLRILTESNVQTIGADAVGIALGGDAPHTDTLPNDHVFILAGGLPPFDLLRSVGIAFNQPAEKISG